jgi:hypothetical protein
MCRYVWVFSLAVVTSGLFLGCGDSGETEADRIGVGAECTESAECESADEDITLECLTQFKGGYCGLEGCQGDADCPEGSGCVAHEDGSLSGNFCFRLCQEKPECNRNRTPDNESNCSSNITFVEEPQNRKACVPPSSG